MDWNSIIILLLSGTSIAGIVSSIIYRRQNKKIKDNEATKSDVDTQREQINLGEEYLKKVYELSEINYQQTLKNGNDNDRIFAKVEEIAIEQRNIVAYLNGDYQSFKQKKQEEQLKNEASLL